jgi:hypothetical protein
MIIKILVSHLNTKFNLDFLYLEVVKVVN